MSLTPDVGPSRINSGPLSPLLLASQGPSLTASPTHHPTHPLPRRSSTGNYSQLSDFHLDLHTDDESGNGVRGIRHVELSISHLEWKDFVFKEKILAILRRLKVPMWTSSKLKPASIHLQKVSGALTNAVFFVSFNPAPKATSPTMSPMLTPTIPPSDPDHPPPFGPVDYPPTLLLRIYGPSSDALISREEELRILHVLSTEYGLGPKVYGTFENGRVEQFFPSRALHADELRDPVISKGIARRMRELHSVNLKLLGYDTLEPVVWTCLDKWIPIAEAVLASVANISTQWAEWAELYGLHKVRDEVARYRNFVQNDKGKGKGVVFAHNDTQYGNLLKLDAPIRKGVPPHHQYIVIDFEYAAPNHRGYDIANHFHEWRANYHHPTLSHSLSPHYPYPSIEQRTNYYRAYLSIDVGDHRETVGSSNDVSQDRVDALEREVRLWSPACSVFWSVWGMVQAAEQVDGLIQGPADVDFDYLAYAMERMVMFRQEATELGAL